MASAGPSVDKLLAAGINFIAVDFDLTLVDVHTEGRWCKPAADLATRVRPDIQALMAAAFGAGMYLAIVTFSPQARLPRLDETDNLAASLEPRNGWTDVSTISKVLEILFPAFGRQIVIRGNDNSWSYAGDGSREGKQSHMASAVEELTHRSATRISRRSTLLIDDDLRNVEVALSNGVNAIMCSPSDPSSVTAALDALPPLDAPGPTHK